MGKFTLSFKRKGTIPPVTPDQPETPSVPDLDKLSFLPKPISKFTIDDIGTTVSIPYTDGGGVIKNPIVFEVVGVNHHTTKEHQKTITLMSKNTVRRVAFDAKETNNPNLSREMYGNNRWSISNVRQWLNSDKAANEWFKAQHEYDEAPVSGKVSGSNGIYANKPGFLAGFEPEVIEHLTEITNITAIPVLDGGGYEETYDKVFLPSYTEIGFGSDGDSSEGIKFSKFTDNASRIKSGQGTSYWLRSPYILGTSGVGSRHFTSCAVTYEGAIGAFEAFVGTHGVTPIIVLH